MAKPIEHTPTLSGKDAWDFVEDIATGKATLQEKKEFGKALTLYKKMGCPFD